MRGVVIVLCLAALFGRAQAGFHPYCAHGVELNGMCSCFAGYTWDAMGACTKPLASLNCSHGKTSGNVCICDPGYYHDVNGACTLTKPLTAGSQKSPDENLHCGGGIAHNGQCECFRGMEKDEKGACTKFAR